MFRNLSLGVRLLALSALLIACASPLKAQSYLENVGIPTFTTAIPVENGFINAGSGNLHLEIPLGSFPQRGGRQYRVALVYDSAIWLPVNGSWQPTNVSTADGSANSWSGWRLVTSGDIGIVNHSTPATNCYGPFIWTAPDGTQHSFPITTALTNSCSPPIPDTPTGNAFASDASGYHMYVSNYTSSYIRSSDGTKVYDDTFNPSQRLEDSNGNYYYFSSGAITDTVGRTPVATAVNGSTITYTVPNAQGTNSTFTLVTKTITVSTSFGQTGFTECCTNPITVVDHVTLPDGTSYQFGYDSGFGLLNSMTLPTGAPISYSFTTFTDAYGNKYRWINTRNTPDGNWSYAPTVKTSCAVTQVDCSQQVTVGKPNGDSIIYTFFLNGGPWNSSVQYYTGSAKLLATVIQCFNFVSILSNGQCSYPSSAQPGPGIIPVTKSATTTLLPIPGSQLSKTSEYFVDSNSGNLNQVSEWNFYSNNLPTVADRSTCISYFSGSNDILNRPSSVTVVNNWSATPCTSIPAADIVAQTNYAYDGSALAPASGMENHDDTGYGTTNTARGNVTQTQRLVSGSYLTTSATYDVTGQMATSTDSKLNLTTLSYADNFFTDPGNGSNPTTYSPAKPTNAYLTSVTQGSLSSSMGYYYGTGQQATARDPNGNSTYSHFADLLNRPTATLLPNGGWSITQYNSTETQVDTYAGITASTPTTGCTGTSGGCRHDQTLLDSSGRIISQILASDPDQPSRVDTQFDINGRVLKTSNPYRSTSDTTYGFETPTYDGLDRVAQVQHADGDQTHTYYGVDVGSIGGRSSPTSGLGYPVATQDETGRVKQVWVDGFGRTIEVDESSATATNVGGTSGSGFVTISGSEQSAPSYASTPAGPNNAGYGANAGGSGVAWYGINGGSASADFYFSGTGTAFTQYLHATSYGFALPSTTTAINGIQVSVTRSGSNSTAANVSDRSTCLLKAGSQVGTCHASGYWGAGGTVTYGSSTDLWGASWSASDMNNSGFGVAFGASLHCINSTRCRNGYDVYASVSSIKVTVYYTYQSSTTYDSGTVTATIGGAPISTTYQQGSTPTSVASTLASSINQNSSLVTASASGATVNLTAKTTGLITNYSLTATSSTNYPGTFSPSFTATASGTALTGGTDGTPSYLAGAAVTTYTYDLNNNLTQVNAATGPQTRSYQYDQLSRITQKTEPETGTTNFYYTTSGAVCSGDPSAVCRRTDARGITTTYGYNDSLNRLTSKTYSDSTPAVTYYYDQTSYNSLTITNGKGRQTGMSDGSGMTAWSFDQLGNITAEQRTINGVTNTISYTYNFDSSISSVTYPSGRKVTYTVGNAQRPTAATDTTNGINYASASSLAMYAPTGAPTSIVYGYVSGGGITETRSYNNRLGLTGIQAVAGGTIGTVLNLAYSYAQSSHNNGNIATQTNNVDTGRTQSYTYDNVNRLLTAQAQATSGADCWGQSFGTDGKMATDALANLFYATSTQCASPQPRFTMNSSPYNNEFTGTGLSYDADGDNTADTVYAYTYDAENRIITASGGGMSGGPYCYTYDGNGIRVEKANANGGLCTGTPTVDVLYWRNIAGNTIAETDSTGNTANANYHEYVFFAGRRVARSDVSSAQVYYYFVDHLGSTRIMTQANGTVCFDAEYFPYGQELIHTNSCNTINTTYKFTGYERDGETGLDYATARYYNSRLGRFMSGDPLGGDNSDPQSLNRYAYVGNNPVNLIDPSGMFLCGPALCPPDNNGSSFGGPGPGVSNPYGISIDYPLNCETSRLCLCHWRGNCAIVFPPQKQSPQPTAQPPSTPTPPAPTPQPPSSPKEPCVDKILDSVSKQFGTNFNATNSTIVDLGAPDLGNVTINVTITFPVGTVSPGQIQTGRFGGGPLGTGNTLHVTRFFVSGVDPVLGVPQETIRAHIDQGNPTAFPFVPGAVSHLDYIAGHFVGYGQSGCP